MNATHLPRGLSRAVRAAVLCTLLVLAGCQADRPRLHQDPLTGGRVQPAPAAPRPPIVRLGGPDELPAAAAADCLVVPAGGAEFPIDLETALSRGGADNPTIALAREAVAASLADELRADVLLLPTLDAGASANVHRGNLESARGVIRDVDRQSVYVGAGAAAVGSSTVGFPGVRLTAHLADAIFEPHAARQAVIARRFDATATENHVLLEVAIAYLELAGAEARLAAVRQSESDLAVIENLTAKFAAKGQGRAADANRARSEARLLEATRHRAEEEAAVAAAELARLLNLDPSVRLRPPAGPPPFVQFVDPRSELEPLVQTALANHPELQARSEDVLVTETRLRKERVRPWVPFLSVGFSAGGFGGGSNLTDTRFGHFNDRTDFDALAVWSLKNLGLGNWAVQREHRALVDEALARRALAANDIRSAVAAALALCAARLREVEVAATRVATAQKAYREDVTRSRNLEGRPIEVLNSVNLLTAARLDLIRARVGYSVAQFQLFVALGQPPAGTDAQCPQAQRLHPPGPGR
jgi:outer membrane protein TolC